MSNEFGLIAADTSRTRAYLSGMETHGLLPCWVLLLDAHEVAAMPGRPTERHKPVVDPIWPEANFDSTAPLRPWLRRLGIPYSEGPSWDINDSRVITLVKKYAPQVIVYSGFGGSLLRSAILATGKDFLHAHGGYLPDFKGSTTNYYSLLDKGEIGASTILLNDKLDSGPVILRLRFEPPDTRASIDHVYDSAARTRVLIETLENWKRDGDWRFDLTENADGETYYIIHPVLKHIAILGS